MNVMMNQLTTQVRTLTVGLLNRKEKNNEMINRWVNDSGGGDGGGGGDCGGGGGSCGGGGGGGNLSIYTILNHHQIYYT